MGFRNQNWIVLTFLAVFPALAWAQNPHGQEIQGHYKRGEDAMRAGQNEVAAREFQEILRLDPHSPQAHANLGVIAFAGKDYAGAAEQFREALKFRPSLWNAQAFLGMCEFRLGRAKEAQALLEQSFGHVQDPTLQMQAGMDLISLCAGGQEPAKALDVLQLLERAHPQDPNLLYTAYRTYTDLAARSLAALAQAAPESAQIHRILAQAQQSQDDFSGAVAQYRKALEIDPTLPGLHLDLGQAILSSSSNEPARREAEHEFRLALAENPADANSEYMLGEIEWLRSKPDAALQHYAEAVRLAPDFVDARVAMGKALSTLGRSQEALAQQSEAVRLDPQNEAAHYRLAQADRKLGKNEDAEREFAVFRKLRDSHLTTRALYQQVQERDVPHQTVAPDEPQ
jgi:tetratricopeptide (TPR) repeat protein